MNNFKFILWQVIDNSCNESFSFNLVKYYPQKKNVKYLFFENLFGAIYFYAKIQAKKMEVIWRPMFHTIPESISSLNILSYVVFVSIGQA